MTYHTRAIFMLSGSQIELRAGQAQDLASELMMESGKTR